MRPRKFISVCENCKHRDQCEQDGLKVFFETLRYDRSGRTLPAVYWVRKGREVFQPPIGCPELRKELRQCVRSQREIPNSPLPPDHDHTLNAHLNVPHFNVEDYGTGTGALSEEQISLIPKARDRKIASLRDIEGLSWAAIAEKMGIKKTAVRQTYHRTAKKILEGAAYYDYRAKLPLQKIGPTFTPGIIIRRAGKIIKRLKKGLSA